ncbi:MAG: methyltransferase type 11 [Opitutae bacterium]|nr:methyltransferase type 11 [Opitutae bacterium]|tara:strand:+ start:1030 stop:1692 length:663 start_codon:yes stop_codon:yes gene_type:complete
MNKNLNEIYQIRFSGLEAYRNAVWKILVKDFFSKWISKGSAVLDLGCGYGEFINNVEGCQNHAMDLNPDARDNLKDSIVFHEQDCSEPWAVKPNSLDLIFSSNFFEHLPNKEDLDKIISHAKVALKPGGKLIALGPNISVLNGHYWDFWDHHTPLSDQSLKELFEIHGLKTEKSIPRFLPYNMVRVRKRPLFLISLYLRCPLAWHFFGKQFLLVVSKSSS